MVSLKDRWKGGEWKWQPVRAEKDWKTHTPNAAYTLDKTTRVL